MKKGVILLVISILFISVICSANFVSAESNETEVNNETNGQANETLSTNETTNYTEIEYTDEELANITTEAGITPDSALYGVDVFFDNARATLTPSPLGKAKVRLNIMQERMAEMEEMAESNKTEEAEEARLQAQKQMQKFDSSIRKVKKKDALELKETLQANTQKLEILKQRLRDSNSGLADAIANALELIEITEDIIVNIPEDLDPKETFIIGSGPLGPATFESMIALCIETGGPLEYCERLEEMCGEMGAETVNECLKMIAQAFTDVELGFEPACLKSNESCEKTPDPHGCDGSYSNLITQTKYCCTDSDRRYSPEYIAIVMEDIGRGNMLNYYYRKGTVEYKIINLKDNTVEEGIETDSCDGNTLTEWICPSMKNHDTLNKRYSEEYECPLGCEDGACMPEAGCSDSDWGINYFEKGTAYGYPRYPPTDPMESFTDKCEGNILREYEIIDMDCVIGGSSYTCENGCEDGACIPEEEPEGEVLLPNGNICTCSNEQGMITECSCESV